MKKITFLMLHLNYGGIEKQVTTLANELAKKYDVEIISLYDLLNGKSFYNLDEKVNVKYIFDCGPNKKEIKQTLKRFKVITLFKEVVKSVKMLYTKYFGLKKIIDKIDTDVLISSRIEFSKQISRSDIITIAQEHSYIDTNKYIRKVQKSFNNINYLIVMTNKAKEKYDEWLEDIKNKPQVVVIPNMVKENTSKEVTNLQNSQIISIGRLEPVKDLYTLVLCFSILSKKYPNLTLKIIGDGSQKDFLKELIQRCGLETKVTLTGKLSEDEINKELLNSDVFVLTSKSESFSLVLCEAMNYGLPCVAFDVDVGPREIIKDNVTGFLVPERSIDLMVEKVSLLLDDIKIRKTMGKSAKDTVKRYYPNKIIKEWEKLF